MALAQAYASTRAARTREPVDVLIISHYDAHGVSWAAAAALAAREAGKTYAIHSRYPETGPLGLPEAVDTVLERYEPAETMVVDIPVNVRAPARFVAALARLAAASKTIYVDHHETTAPHIPAMIASGVYPMYGDGAAVAAMMLAMSGGEEQRARGLLVLGLVADRDRSVLALAGRDEVEQRYLQLANKLDMVVRNPRLLSVETQADVARLLVSGVGVIEGLDVEYPPERLAAEAEKTILEEGEVALLVDMAWVQVNTSMWVPKTLEQLLLRRHKNVAVAVVPGYNPRTKALEGWDVRLLQYWLAEPRIELAEAALASVEQAAASGRVVGGGDYISIRLESREQALQLARRLHRRIEGSEPATAHLVSDRYVAEAVRRDFRAILERLEDCLRRG